MESGADGGTRTRMAKAEGFSYQLRLSPPPWGVCGLDYTFTVAHGLRCCPSSLYTFRMTGLARDRHLTGFPEFEQFCIRRFHRSTQFAFKSLVSTGSTTSARAYLLAD